MKRLLIACSLLLFLGITSLGATTLGGRVVGVFDIQPHTGIDTDTDFDATIGAGISIYGRFDFFEFGKCKLGTRPEVGIFFPLQSSGDSLNPLFLTVPIWLNIDLSEKLDLGIGLGFEIMRFAPILDIAVSFNAGPGKLVINPSCAFIMSGDYFRLFTLIGVGYQYTF